MNDEKRVPRTYATEVSGEIEVQRVAAEAGWIYRPRAGLDVGIDLELEPVADGVPTGRIIKAQVKSGASYFERDGGESFAFRPERADIRYWHRINTPVLIVLHHPAERAAYALEFHKYAREHAAELEKGLIWFARKRDRLTSELLRELAQIETPGIRTGAAASVQREPAPLRETLHSNVLAISDTPERLFHVPVTYREEREVRERSVRDAAPFLLWNGELWTFADPRIPENGLSGVIDTPGVRILDSAAWLLTRDGDVRYRTLLYRHFRQHTRAVGLRSDSEQRLYFPSRDGSTRIQRYRSLRHWTERWVARPVWDRARTRTVLWEHRALKAELIRVGTRWYLSLVPAWCFTVDGRTPIQAPPGAVTRRISHEYNLDVFRLVVFWRAVLFRNEGVPLTLSCRPQTLTISHQSVSSSIEFGIPDDRADLSLLDEVADDASDSTDSSDELESEQADVREHA